MKLWLSIAVLCSAAVSSLGQVVNAGTHAKLLNLPARFMWGWGANTSGYCGSMSIQTTALYFGNWLTQDAVRGSNGGHDGPHAIELGDENRTCCSGAKAASHFRLRAEEWKYWEVPHPQAPYFVKWIKESVDMHAPVVFGVFISDDDDAEFDHIVPVVGYDEDAIYWNDLYYNHTLRLALSDSVKTRKECMNLEPWPAPKSYCLPKEVTNGFRVLGNHDPLGELLPVRLEMATNFEPDYSEEDRKFEAPSELSGAVIVTGLVPHARYALLRYDNVDSIPIHGNFLKRALSSGHKPEAYFHATGNGTWQMPVRFPSNSTQFFRCVRADGDIQMSEEVII